MKKVLSLLIIVSMLFPLIALADYSSMTDEELEIELRAEITRRASLKEGKQVLVDADGLTVTLTGGPVWKQLYDGTHYIELPIMAVNSSEQAIGLSNDDIYVNGWKISGNMFLSLEPGMKTKETITLYQVDINADMEKLEDLEDVKIRLHTFNTTTYYTITDNISITISF